MEPEKKSTTETQEKQLAKSEILFLYESTYSIPNGDPFTGEQRYDEETKRVLVSDVMIKRFVRDYLSSHGSFQCLKGRQGAGGSSTNENTKAKISKTPSKRSSLTMHRC